MTKILIAAAATACVIAATAPVEAKLATNKLATNGVSMNRISLNGLRTNRISLNGVAAGADARFLASYTVRTVTLADGSLVKLGK